MADLIADLKFIRDWLKEGSNAAAYWLQPPFLVEIQDAEADLGLEFPPELYSYLLSGALSY